MIFSCNYFVGSRWGYFKSVRRNLPVSICTKTDNGPLNHSTLLSFLHINLISKVEQQIHVYMEFDLHHCSSVALLWYWAWWLLVHNVGVQLTQFDSYPGVASNECCSTLEVNRRLTWCDEPIMNCNVACKIVRCFMCEEGERFFFFWNLAGALPFI